jgi:drug/metabolite transporter (DMT)-like permease
MELALPIALSLMAAALWGISAHIQRLGLDGTDALTGAFISVGTGAAMMWVAAPFFVDAAWWTAPATLVFVAVGVIFPALGQRFQIASVDLVGASLTASLSSVAPVVAVAIGVGLLGETLGLQGAIGIGIMVTGFVLATHSPRGIKRGFPAWALLVPLGAAVVRGIAQPGLKIGLADLPSPAFALLVGTTVSTVTLGVLLLPRAIRGEVRRGSGWVWFAVNGAMFTLGILFLNYALSLGTVTLVSPLAATTPLWTLAFGALLFKREQLGPKHLAIALMVVVGAVLIVTR